MTFLFQARYIFIHSINTKYIKTTMILIGSNDKHNFLAFSCNEYFLLNSLSIKNVLPIITINRSIYNKKFLVNKSVIGNEKIINAVA